MNNNPLERLFDDLDYQILAPEVTTMGECECGSASRGGRTCIYCLQDKLGNTTSHALADSYILALYNLKAIQNKYNEHKAK